MYAIVSTGGKQYRVERGQTLLVERLPVEEGASCMLEPLLYVDGERVLDSGQDGPPVRVEARVVAHERGPKLRVVKFKPKRGYKRRTGHRQELTRIEITAIEAGDRPRRGRARKDASDASGSPASEQEQTGRAASHPAQAARTRSRSRSSRTESERKEETDGS
jgi:large subunit ribosomal protein L21